MILTNSQEEALLQEKQQLIEVHQLERVFTTPAGSFRALKGVDIQVNKGEFVAVIGKSGSGKSTLINILTGIDRPTSGEVWIGETPVHTLSESQLASWRGRNVGVVFQFFQLLPTLTLVENVLLAMDLNNSYDKHERRDRAMQLLELVKIADHAHKLPSEVSGGQQQRVAIARALANDPPLIVADEPTGNLDSKTAEEVFQLLEKLVADGKTILMVTHDDDLAKRVNRTIMIADGKVINEYIVQALSALNSDQIVEVTNKVKPIIYEPGETVIQQGTVGDEFYIIVDGDADIFIERPGGTQSFVNRLKKGQYFGEMALIGNGLRTATVRAGPESGLSTVALDINTFNELISDSRTLREELTLIMERRSMELMIHSVGDLSSEDVSKFDMETKIRSYPPGEIIIKQGDIGYTFYLILEGSAHVMYEQPSGKQVFLNELQRGQYFGEMALMGNGRRNATVRAAGDIPVKVVELDKEDFNRLIKRLEPLRKNVPDNK